MNRTFNNLLRTRTRRTDKVNDVDDLGRARRFDRRSAGRLDVTTVTVALDSSVVDEGTLATRRRLDRRARLRRNDRISV